MKEIEEATNYAIASNKLEENDLNQEQIEFIKEMLQIDDDKGEFIEKTLKKIKEKGHE